MADPIPLNLPPRDPRAELVAKLADAPADHAEAMLAAYEVLQGLHDKGVLEIVRGAIGSSDDLIQMGVAAAKSPDAIRGFRNAVLLLKALGEIDPEVLKTFTQALPKALDAVGKPSAPPGIWRLMKGFSNKDTRRGLAAMQAMLESFGRSLGDDEHRL